ncbi:arylesterase [Paracoccus caeni]|uniref:Arylesterase n=1 Tax=Paracoccus caeni TaxID=657651 RepID=A0A934S9K7_9RHOB|nr:arylesterase [Paracoccus caeni]MBK4214671.1 arylesterase [Paracoccus caeni]
MIGRRGFLASGAALVLSGPARADQPIPRVLMFGDSMTAGFGLPPADGLVPQLQEYLTRQDRRAMMINGGLSGDTTYGGRVRILWSMRRHRPDAVIVELGGNDMLMRIPPDRAEANLDVILETAKSGGRPVLLVGIHPPRGDAEIRRRWAAIWPRLAQRHKVLLLPDIYGPLVAGPPERQRELLLADGIHPSAEGVKLLVERLGPHLLELLDQLE